MHASGMRLRRFIYWLWIAAMLRDELHEISRLEALRRAWEMTKRTPPP